MASLRPLRIEMPFTILRSNKSEKDPWHAFLDFVNARPVIPEFEVGAPQQALRASTNKAHALRTKSWCYPARARTVRTSSLSVRTSVRAGLSS